VGTRPGGAVGRTGPTTEGEGQLRIAVAAEGEGQQRVSGGVGIRAALGHQGNPGSWLTQPRFDRESLSGRPGSVAALSARATALHLCRGVARASLLPLLGSGHMRIAHWGMP